MCGWPARPNESRQVGVAVAPTVELYQERSFRWPERARALSLEEQPPLAEADGEPLRWDAVVAAAVGDVAERRVIESYEECEARALHAPLQRARPQSRLLDPHFQPGTRPACSIHLCISGPCASSRVFTFT